MPAGTIETTVGRAASVSSGAANEPVKIGKIRGLPRVANAVFQKRKKTTVGPFASVFDSNIWGLTAYVIDSVALADACFFDFKIIPSGDWESCGRVSRRTSWIISRDAVGEFRVFWSGWLREMPRVLVLGVGRGRMWWGSARGVGYSGLQSHGDGKRGTGTRPSFVSPRVKGSVGREPVPFFLMCV